MIDPSAEYPGQIDTSDPTGYPYGAAINESVPGANDGTPLDEKWLSDHFGFQQALLDAAGLTPTGVPDKIGACQQLTALLTLFPNVLDGGTYAPAAPVVIGGAGLEMDGPLNVDGAADFDGTVSFSAAVTFASGATTTFGDAAEFNDTAQFDGATTFNGVATFAAGSAPVFDDDATFNGETEFNDTATFTDAAVFEAPTTFQSTTDHNGQANFDNAITFGVGGHLRWRTTAVTDTEMDLSVTTARIYFEESAVFTQARDHTLLDDQAGTGDMIEVRLNNAYTQTFKREDASTITSITAGLKLVKFIFISGQWELFAIIDANFT